jgi:phosphatidylglycerol:prolipoprotein diacylglycerol transferase
VFPTLYHFLKDTFGIEISFLEIVNTFGLFVAFAIGAAYWAMQKEFSRRTELGFFKKTGSEIKIGEAAPMSEYVTNALFAFVFGFKILYLMQNSGDGFVPQDHIFTSEGNLFMGFLIALVAVVYRYYLDKKERKNPPIIQKVTLSLADEMGNITAVALISGFLGAKIFHILETPENFSIAAIAEQLFTTGGWTFFGGLICGALGVLWYTSKKGYPLWHVLDAGVPAMMLSYGVGRFGCHFSGDGDWGIANLNPSSWLPDWLWAYKYPHNVLGKSFGGADMEKIPGCEGNYCYQLIDPVYPTPLYEAIMALALFAVLWFYVRKRTLKPGGVLSIYLVMAGLERFLIEMIREHGDSLYKIGDMLFSQAQMISLFLIVSGIVLWILSYKGLLKAPMSPAL